MYHSQWAGSSGDSDIHGDCYLSLLDNVGHQCSSELGSAPNHLFDFSYNTCNGVNPNDIYVIQPFNYGLRLDGKGNPVCKAGLQFNGQDPFDPRHGNYFYIQPWQHHTHTPADVINVYSFALHTEQHQPTGTTNLSRIDSSVLILRLADHVRHRSGLKPKLQIDLSYE